MYLTRHWRISVTMSYADWYYHISIEKVTFIKAITRSYSWGLSTNSLTYLSGNHLRMRHTVCLIKLRAASFFDRGCNLSINESSDRWTHIHQWGLFLWHIVEVSVKQSGEICILSPGIISQQNTSREQCAYFCRCIVQQNITQIINTITWG